MKVKLKKMSLVAVIAACALLSAAEENVLWWMFDETADIYDVNGTSFCKINELAGRGEAEGQRVNGIRVAAYQGDALLGYLALADGESTRMEVYPMPTTDFDAGTDSWNAGPTYAYLAPYASDPSTMFMIELGNWDAARGPGDEWLVLAHSDAATREDLRAFIDVGDFEMHTTLEWTGGGYSVPEPSGGMLLLVGGALLSLRRPAPKETIERKLT